MREYLVRVRHVGDEYRATIREVAPARDPGTLPLMGDEGAGTASTEPAAILAAVIDLRLPEHREDRRQSRYSC